MYLCIYAYINVCMCIYLYTIYIIYVHTHIYIHAYHFHILGFAIAIWNDLLIAIWDCLKAMEKYGIAKFCFLNCPRIDQK